MVDMGSQAITSRLRELSRQLAVRGFVCKGVDMSAPAVTARLKTMGALSDMCRRLVKAGEGLRQGTGDAGSGIS